MVKLNKVWAPYETVKFEDFHLFTWRLWSIEKIIWKKWWSAMSSPNIYLSNICDNKWTSQFWYVYKLEWPCLLEMLRNAPHCPLLSFLAHVPAQVYHCAYVLKQAIVCLLFGDLHLCNILLIRKTWGVSLPTYRCFTFNWQ